MTWSRRTFLTSLSRTALVLSLEDILSLAQSPQTPSHWLAPNLRCEASPRTQRSTLASGRNPSRRQPSSTLRDKSGLNAKTIYGGEHKNRYLLETTGCGVAFFDYDHDDWLDIFLVNGSRIEGFPKGQEPICHLFKNNRDGTFTDVTAKAGLARTGWGQGCCVGDYNNDGWNDLFVSYYGQNVLYRNNGDGTFTDVTAKAGLAAIRRPAGTPAAPSSTTTATATSTSSSPTTSTSTSRPPRFPKPPAAPTKASRSPAVPPACKAAKTSSIATTATAPSPMSREKSGMLEHHRHLCALRRRRRPRR